MILSKDPPYLGWLRRSPGRLRRSPYPLGTYAERGWSRKCACAKGLRLSVQSANVVLEKSCGRKERKIGICLLGGKKINGAMQCGAVFLSPAFFIAAEVIVHLYPACLAPIHLEN